MRTALLADIHGNAPALESVLAAARDAGAERLLIAGDLVGYYYDIGRVLDILSDWDWVAIQGNHEHMLACWLAGNDQEDILARYGSAIARAADELGRARLEMLTSLPPTRTLQIGGCKALLCHGTPWDRDAYVYPDAIDEVKQRFCVPGYSIVIFGHTHYPVHWKLAGGDAVNPGSVGQPRDGKPGACWALWEPNTGAISLRREVYDPAPVISACKKNDPELLYLREILTRCHDRKN